MTRFRSWGLALLALVLLVLPGRSEEPKSLKKRPNSTLSATPTYRIYSLAELGDDPELGKWVAETIPAVIEPGSWDCPATSEHKPVLRHYGPKKILVVYHTPAVQASVEGFLKNLKKALPREKERAVATGKTLRYDPGAIPA